jgi:hypothetical protein
MEVSKREMGRTFNLPSSARIEPVLASFSRAQMLKPFIVGDIDPVVRISLRRGMKWFINTSSGRALIFHR